MQAAEAIIGHCRLVINWLLELGQWSLSSRGAFSPSPGGIVMPKEEIRPAQPDSYWRRTRRPVYALAFVLPMVLVYEAGVPFINPDFLARQGRMLRDGTDTLIRRSMGWLFLKLGFGGFVMTGLVVVAVLVAWQVLSRGSWRVELGTLLGMVVESLIVGLALLAIVMAVNRLHVATPALGHVTVRSLPREIVLALGAGVYEEFLFRMVLVGALAATLRAVTQRGRTPCFMTGVLIAAAVFALAHQRGVLGEEFRLTMFLFRVFAALYFGMVFFLRGLGIAAGAHAVYHVSYWLLIYGDGGAQ
jgi:hypothetical protein